MSGNSVKILHEAIGEKYRRRIRFEAESKIMKEIVGHVLGTRADFEDGHNFVDGTHSRPDPSDGLFVRLGWVGEGDGSVRGAQDGAELIELDHGDR